MQEKASAYFRPYTFLISQPLQVKQMYFSYQGIDPSLKIRLDGHVTFFLGK